MKAALDVFYSGGQSHAACVVFEAWFDAAATETFRTEVFDVRPYRPGRFFERELEPLLAVLELSGERFGHIVIDGYVHLKEGAKGLGAHLQSALSYPAVVIGVAKSPLAIADRFVPVHRGRSSKPLFISATGCSVDEAASAIAAMHGPYRIPTLLRLADRIAREV
jgi:deoxyribonuclease V